eukprot:15434108-Alexandrium_andersonii.AAC.1
MGRVGHPPRPRWQRRGRRCWGDHTHDGQEVAGLCPALGDGSGIFRHFEPVSLLLWDVGWVGGMPG